MFGNGYTYFVPNKNKAVKTPVYNVKLDVKNY